MHVHILGICGTFMAGIAALARECGHRVSGCDANAWPPMSTQLEALGIEIERGYSARLPDPLPDVVVVGNVISRGNPALEAVMDAGLAYTSGPQWLAEHVLARRHVIAIAGTHGKTTTTSLVAYLLDRAGLEPGFLIGGVAADFPVSARLGKGRHFVIEADEYDTAFFDKQSKFLHYRPRTAILNNLEFDHADIFPDLAAIERQFHLLVRTVPGSGSLIVNGADPNLARVLERGCWSHVQRFNAEDGWLAHTTAADAAHSAHAQSFTVQRQGVALGSTALALAGAHNRSNALAAIAALDSVGVPPVKSLALLAGFQGVKRRLEKVGSGNGVDVYDDFAHHPTAIAATIAALHERAPGARVLAVVEPRSNTMRLGTHADTLAASLDGAAVSFVYLRPDLRWDVHGALGSLGARLRVCDAIPALIAAIVAEARPGDQVLVMSNGDFGGVHAPLVAALQAAGRA